MHLPESIRVILSGGGTGGHIFPAIAIAREIQTLVPAAQILFVGARGKMEMDKVPQAGFAIRGLPVTALHRRFTLKNLIFPFRLIISLIMARRMVRSFQPDLVIGTGGFASGPILRIASRMGIPTLLQEQNSFPGLTNRILARKVQRICVSYPDLDTFFPAHKTILTGNPVRSDLPASEGKRPRALAWCGFDGSRPVIFVFGGSLGARTLNQCMMEAVDLLFATAVDVLWQTGAGNDEVAIQAVESAGARNIKVMPFIAEMDLAYAAADLVVCRAGAITLSELGIVGKPAILVPFPAAAGDHQTKNARVVVANGAALLVPDHEAKDRLVEEMIRLARDKQQLAAMGRAMKKMGKPDAARDIAKLAVEMAENRK